MLNEENLDELLSLGLDSITDNAEAPLEVPVEETNNETEPFQEDNVVSPGSSGEEVTTEEKPKVRFVIKDRDVEMTIEDEAEAVALMQQGLNFTRKTQQLSKYKKTIDSLESNGITDDDLALLAKVKSGDRDAVSYLTKQVGIDPMDLIDYDSKYVVPQAEQAFKPSDTVLQYDSIIRENEPEVYAKLSNALSSMPQPTLREIASNDSLYSALYEDVKSGTFDVINRELQRDMLTRMSPLEKARLDMDSNAYLSAYANIAQRMSQPTNAPQQEQQYQEPQQTPQPQLVQPKANVNKVAVQSGVRARETKGEVDVWNTSNDELERIIGRLPIGSIG